MVIERFKNKNQAKEIYRINTFYTQIFKLKHLINELKKIFE